MNKEAEVALAGAFTGFVDVPLDYVAMMKRLAATIRIKHYDKGVSYQEKGIDGMMDIVREEMKELEDELNEFRSWAHVEREALHVALSALLLSQLAREMEVRS